MLRRLNERLSPRQLTALFSGGLLLVSLVVLSVGTGLALQAAHLQDLDAILEAQAQVVLAEAQSKENPNIQDAAEVNAAMRSQIGASVGMLYRNQQLVWKSGPLAAPSEPLDLNFFSNPAPLFVGTFKGWRILSRRKDNLIVQIAHPLSSLETTMRSYWRATLTGTALIALIAGFLTNSVLKFLIRPLRQLALRVQDLNSNATIPATNVKGEIGVLARALEQSISELRETRMREARFLANASHELRTPITALLALLEQTLARTRSNEELLSAILRAQRSATHLKDLSSNLLALSRSGAGAAPVRVRVDLLVLALEVTDQLTPLAANKGLDLEADGEPVVVSGDGVLLRQLLENLVTNAIKYTLHGAVVVRVSREENQAVVCVNDTGIGIPNDKLSMLFEPFLRVNLEHRDGFGLGLAVAKSVVEAHDGSIKIDSRIGHGTQVEVRLPVARL